MLNTFIVFDCKEEIIKLEEYEVPSSYEEINQKNTSYEEQINNLEKSNLNLISTILELDFRLFEIESIKVKTLTNVNLNKDL